MTLSSTVMMLAAVDGRGKTRVDIKKGKKRARRELDGVSLSRTNRRKHRQRHGMDGKGVTRGCELRVLKGE